MSSIVPARLRCRITLSSPAPLPIPKHNKGEQRRPRGLSSAPVRSPAGSDLRGPGRGDPAARAPRPPRRAASSAFVWPGRDPPPPAPFPPLPLPPHPSLAGRLSGGSPPRPLRLRFRGLSKRERGFAGFSLGRAGLARGGVRDRRRERGTQSELTSQPAPSPSLCKAAWDRRSTAGKTTLPSRSTPAPT